MVGFGARRLFDDDGIEAKYLNTSDTAVYHKTKVLFGLDLAKREIAKRRQVVVVEGYTDVMAMHLAGVPTAVASCGTAFGAEHIAVIRRLIGDDSFDLGEVIYTFDGDAAGQAAALKAFEGDQSFAAQTFVAIAPDGKDPCELRQAAGTPRCATWSPAASRCSSSPSAPCCASTTWTPPRAGSPRCSARCRWWPGSSARTCATSTPAGWPAGPAGTTSRWWCAGSGRPRARRPSRGPQRHPPPGGAGRPAPQRPAAAPAAGGAQGRAADPRGRRAELRRAAGAGVHPPRVRRGAPRGAGRRRGGRWRAAARLAGGGAGRVPHGDAPAGHRARRGAAGAAPAGRPTGDRDATDEARYVASIIAGVRLVLVEAQVAELKARLQRTNADRGARRLHADLRRPRAAGAVQDRTAGQSAPAERSAMNLLRRLLGRAELPEGFTGRLDADEQVLAAAVLGDGGAAGRHLARAVAARPGRRAAGWAGTWSARRRGRTGRHGCRGGRSATSSTARC